MSDRDLMEGLLLSVKGAGDLYLHGTIESSTEKVRSAFDSSLSRSLQMQKQIYDKMSEKGWYAKTNAPQQKICQTQQKFAQG